MGAKALEVASLARGTRHRSSLHPFSRPSERFLDRGSRGFGAERFLSSREECLIDLNSGPPRHVYIIQNGCVHIPARADIDTSVPSLARLCHGGCRSRTSSGTKGIGCARGGT